MNLEIKPKIILIVENGKIFDIESNFKFLNNFKIKRIKEYLNPDDAEIILVENGQAEQIKNISIDLIKDALLVFNYDNESLREICKSIDIKKVGFGFSEEADFKVSDVNELEDSTNLKINYKGNTVPVWLKKLSGKDEIYIFLSAISVGILLGLNIVEISDSLFKAISNNA